MTPVSLSSMDRDFVEERLNHVLASSAFTSSAQLAQLLEYLVRQSLEGRGDRLKQYTIATEALGRQPDFDPDTDPAVRVTVGRLRRQLSAYYAGEGSKELFQLDIPSGSYVARFNIFKTLRTYEARQTISENLLSKKIPVFVQSGIILLIFLLSINLISLQYYIFIQHNNIVSLIQQRNQ